MMKKQLYKIINSDLFRYENKINKKLYYKNLLINRQFRYSVLMKKKLFLKERKHILFYFYRTLLRIYSGKYGIKSPYHTKIGQGF